MGFQYETVKPYLSREGIYLKLDLTLKERRFNHGIYPLAPFYDDTSRIKARAFVISMFQYITILYF